MTNEEIVKVNSDEVAVSTPSVVTINVEEVKQTMEMVEATHQEELNNYNIQMGNLQAQLDKAAEAGVTPDGIIGEVVIEPVVEEVITEIETSTGEVAPIMEWQPEPIVETDITEEVI